MLYYLKVEEKKGVFFPPQLKDYREDFKKNSLGKGKEIQNMETQRDHWTEPVGGGCSFGEDGRKFGVMGNSTRYPTVLQNKEFP